MIGASASLGIVVRMWSGLTDVAPNPPRHVCTSRILNIAAVASMHGSLKSKLLMGLLDGDEGPTGTRECLQPRPEYHTGAGMQ